MGEQRALGNRLPLPGRAGPACPSSAVWLQGPGRAQGAPCSPLAPTVVTRGHGDLNHAARRSRQNPLLRGRGEARCQPREKVKLR